MLETDDRFRYDIEKALEHQWLPIAGTDYAYSWVQAVAGGVKIEYRSYRQP
jgi:hypothetical protein